MSERAELERRVLQILESKAFPLTPHDEAEPCVTLADVKAALLSQAQPAPRIVCLCGSTRFYEYFQRANYEETMAGRIVLSVGFYPHAQKEVHHSEDVGCTAEQKIALDELHKRKIDLCDEVFVLNVGRYIGSSTRSEIEYAEAHGKTIRYLESGEAQPMQGGKMSRCGIHGTVLNGEGNCFWCLRPDAGTWCETHKQASPCAICDYPQGEAQPPSVTPDPEWWGRPCEDCKEEKIDCQCLLKMAAKVASMATAEYLRRVEIAAIEKRAQMSDLSFFRIGNLVWQGLQDWKAKGWNKKWWKRIDGTPIPNDLTVCIAERISKELRAIAPPAGEGTLSDNQIKYTVNRFLAWRLPENFNPDAGISFKSHFNEHTTHPMKHEPVGTNLFDATQTEAMVRYLIEGLPPAGEGSRVYEEVKNERVRQDAKWGGPSHDDTHVNFEWCDYILEHNRKAKSSEWRKRMIEVAALAIAAVESHDRVAAAGEGSKK